MDVLPPDLLADILLRLSATKLVTVARHVCRSWRAIISDPTFVNNHVNPSLDDEDSTTLLFYRNNGLFIYSSIRNLQTSVVRLGPKGNLLPEEKADHKPITLVCKGLLLHAYRSSNLIKFYLCNPVLNQCRPLTPIEYHPLTIRRSRSFSGRENGLGSIPDQDVGCSFGFGFDPITNQYKIVVVSRSKNQRERRSKVYCSTFDSTLGKKTISGWKRVGSFDHIIQCDSNGVFVKGRLHWLLFSHNTTRDRILTFNLNTEELGLMSRWPVQYKESKRLGVLGGTKLCMYIDYVHNFNMSYCSVWVMQEYQELHSWFECYRFDNSIYNYDWFCYWKKDLFVFRHQIGQYFVVDRTTNEIVDSIGHTKVKLKISFVSTFVPCFLSIVDNNHKGEEEEEQEEEEEEE